MRLVVVLSIAVWYVLTAISSISLKQALTSSAETLTTPLITPLWSSVLVSILPCLGYLSPTVWAATTSSINNNSNPKWVMILLGLIQGLYILTLFLSFSLEGVALTYTIKALEPMGNLVLLKILGRPAHVTQLSFLGLCILPYGIYLSQHQSENWGPRGLGFALFNVALTSTRSVLLKLYTYNPVMSYFHISAIGLLFLIVAVVLNVGFDDFAPVQWMTSPNLIFGVTSFVGYNFASFFVLSNIDPVLHGACNVLKRCTTVALAIVMIPQEAAMLTPQQLFGVGFTLVALGVYVYGRTTRSNNKIRLVRRSLTVMVSLQLFTINQSIYLPTMHTANYNSMDRHNFVVWTFPFAPPTGGGGVGEEHHRSEYSEQYQDKDYTFVCPYRNACQKFGDHSSVSALSPSSFQLNLQSVTSGSSNFYQYVRDHAYHKVRHGKEFPLHIQAIAMISLLSKNPGSCVRTWGAKTQHCDLSMFQDYDPYQLHFNTTNYPLEFLQLEGRMDLAPNLSQHHFAMWGYDFGSIPGLGEYTAGKFNSGEDVQSFASVTWYPFVSDVVDKKVALKTFDGHYIANSLASVLETPSGSDIDVDRMKLVSLLSIYLGKLANVKKNAEYISMYSKLVGEAFGARSKKTHRDLLSVGIKSYFSACLTLTTNMIGAKLNPDTPQCNSMICNDLVFPRSQMAMEMAPQQNSQADDEPLILMVDVIDENAVPFAVREKALKFSADIPKNYRGKDLSHGYLERMDYAYRLLSMYANRAKVVITSRIHVGLPAAALGVPVIFVEKGNWLPGGKQSAGRVEGLLEVFHRLDLPNGRNWTYGDLNDSIPPNPGNHLADRYRASFWNRLKRQSNFYADAAKLFGMIPLQRLGHGMTNDDVHSVFHFIWDRDKHPSWHARRAIEQIFFFHPSAKLYIHGTSNEGTVLHPSLESFVESGYDLEYQTFYPKELADQIANDDKLSYHSELVQEHNYPVLVTWKYGGVFVSSSTHLIRELPSTLGPAVVLDLSGNMALLILSKRQPVGDIFKVLTNNSNSVEMSILASRDTKSCMEDLLWVGVAGLKESFGVVVDESVASNSTLLLESACFKVLDENCIFCDEIHWEFSLNNGNSNGYPMPQQEGHSQLQDSHGTLMNRYPDEYLSVKNYIDKYQRAGQDLRLLSFGSSIGLEAISLATLYYNETKYQHLSIYGVDIDEATLETARENVIKAGSQIQRNITFFHGKSTPISVYGKYDVIFANSVLCFHPKPLNQILLHFPFSQFENTLQLLDAALEDGGLLAIVNTNYNFNETETSKKYVPVAKCKDNSFVPRVDRETTTLINIEGKDLDCVWVKIGS